MKPDLYYNQYVKITRVALQGKKRLLEKLGIRRLSSKTAAQRGEVTINTPGMPRDSPKAKLE